MALPLLPLLLLGGAAAALARPKSGSKAKATQPVDPFTLPPFTYHRYLPARGRVGPYHPGYFTLPLLSSRKGAVVYYNMTGAEAASIMAEAADRDVIFTVATGSPLDAPQGHPLYRTGVRVNAFDPPLVSRMEDHKFALEIDGLNWVVYILGQDDWVKIADSDTPPPPPERNLPGDNEVTSPALQ